MTRSLRFGLAVVFFAAGCTRDLSLPQPPPTTAFITGRVVAAVPGSSASAPVAGARVAVLNSNLNATSDERGQFILGPLPEGTYRLFFSSKSRQRIVTGVPVKPGATNSVGDVSLQENALLTGRALIQGRTSGNVGVTVFSPGTDYVTTTADNGGWLLGNLPEGSIRATAWRPGFAPATTTDITLQGGVVTSAVDLILEPEAVSAPPGSITGRVIVIGRDDHAGVTVKAISTQSREVKATATTTATGEFVLANLSSDLYLVTLDLEGYPSARVPNLAVAGGVQLELVDPIVLALAGEGNVASTEPIGGPSGPLYSLDGGQTSSDGGTVLTSDGGTVGAECTDDNQCASGRRCIDNRCVGCSVNVQCRPGYSCQSGDCVRDCQSNAECPQGLACIAGSCTTCLTSSDCRDPSLVCNPQSQCAHCRDRSECPAGKACLVTGCGDCALDADCGTGAICEQGVCTPGECHGNADCAASEACVGRDCGMCTVDSQCRVGQLCISGACVTGNCRSVLDCGAGQVCLGNQCGSCANDTQCGTGNLCVPGTNGLRCTPGTCRVSGDCTGASAGQLCVNNTCQPCGTNNLCSNGQICNAQGRCVVGDCFTSADCTGSKAGFACLSGNCTPCGANQDCGASGYVCVGGQCRVGNCASPTDCTPGQLCTNNACVGCTQSSQCPGGQVCDQGLCQSGNCTSTADCTGGRLCLNRVCSQCTLDSQCGAGNLCLSGACTPGNCRTPTDCFVASTDGGTSGTQLCTSNFCAACASNGQCGAGKVCDVNLCFPGNCLGATDCAPGQLCLNRTCSACTQDTQCGAGRLCLNGACAVANCRVPTDCAGSGDGGTQLCQANSCAPCTGPAQCGAGKVCDTNFCFAGDCVSAADCANGRLCLNRTCTACSSDGQCGAGRLCISGGCVTGTCRNDSECSGGTQLCDLAPGPNQYTCRACSPLNSTGITTCGSGRVCDSAGFCRFGNCLQNNQCTAVPGQVCTNYSCTSCTSDTQCSGGQLCVGTLCKTGNCHGTGADPNIDCAATNGVCVNNLCVGNCRTNTDCAATGYCDQTSHLCAPCTGPGQCGVGKVCTPGGGGNTCVAAQCSSLEPNCSAGSSCISGTCVQLGPDTSFDGGGSYTEAAAIATSVGHPMPVSSANTVYFSVWESSGPTGQGAHTLAFEPGTMALRWRVRDSTAGLNTTKTSFAGSGIVLPAPGFPMGELFLANDSNGGAIAHRADTGAQAWRITFPGNAPTAFVAGLASGQPHVAWTVGNVAYWVRTDGTGLRQVTMAGCNSWLSAAWGTRAILNVCDTALYLVDPVTATVKVVPHGGNSGNVIPNGALGPVSPVWRPPNNYVARGVNSGTVTSDIIAYMGRGGGQVWLFAANVPDDWVTNNAPPSTWAMWGSTLYDFANTPLTIDATGALQFSSGSQLYKVNLFTGAQISKAPLNTYSSTFNVATGGQFIDVMGSSVQGFVLTDGATTTPPSAWNLPNLSGFPALFPNFTPSDRLLLVQNNSSNQPTVRSLAPGINAPGFVTTPPAWPLGGNSMNQNTAPAYQCTADAQCAATQTCLFNQCTGTCRNASQCAAGQGCVSITCGACTGPASCRTGEVCWSGQCIACAGMGCCNTSADCSGNEYCLQGTCRAGPQTGGSPGNFSLSSAITRSNPSITSVAPDGTMYVGDTNASNQPFWRIVSTAGALLSTTPVVPAGLLSSGQRPVVMIASNNTQPTLWHGGNSTLYSAPASSSVAAWTTATYSGYAVGFMRLAQGISSVTGSAKPTVYATISNGYNSEYLLAIDAAAASGGGANAGLLWKGNLGTTCGLTNYGTLEHLVIGSDGTVYVVCFDGSVEAWAADGDPATGPAPNRLGLMKWRTGVPSWSAAGGRPAIGKAPGGDVLYVPRTVSLAGMAVWDTTTASNGSLPIEVNVEATTGILTDAAGRAIVLGNWNSNRGVALVSPAGAVLFEDKTRWNPYSGVLTADGQLIFADIINSTINPPKNVTAVSVANPAQVVQLWSLTAPGNTPLDASSHVVVLSTAQVATGLVAFDYAPVGSLPRTLNGFALPNSQGPMPNVWNTLFADQQRRSSLKTQ